MIKKLATIMLMIVMATAIVQPAFATSTVRVTLPSFSVTLNGQTTSNDYSEYPLLVYRDITYFPMTYFDCRLLGLRTDWTAEAGLNIGKNEDAFYEYVREVRSARNAKSQSAQIATGRICVNGTVIDNAREEYPLLLFRDVTYFPLTWRFAVEEFGWDYTFDAQNGLVITNSAAAFETPEAWSGYIEGYAGRMGTGNAKIFCRFHAGLAGTVDSPDILEPYVLLDLCNGTKDIVILPDTGHWEFQIYRVMGSREELVYRRAIPIFSGELPASHFAGSVLPDHYWQGDVTPGAYRLEIVHPEQYVYRLADSQEILYEPIVTNESVLSLSRTITIE